jgi:hypothetical protein
MQCVSIRSARYVRDYIIYLECSDGAAGEVDLKDIIHRYGVAKPLKDKQKFSAFYLDEWPTLAWPCGFDIAPETLHAGCVSDNEVESKVAEDAPEYRMKHREIPQNE